MVRKGQSVRPGSNAFLFGFPQGVNPDIIILTGLELRGVSLMGKVRAEGGIYSLTYEDVCIQNGLYSKGQLVGGDKSVMR